MNFSARGRVELARAIRNGRFERTETGIYFSAAHLLFGGVFGHEVIRNGISLGRLEDPNLVVNEGLDHILDVLFKGGTQVDPWYVLIFEGDYTPVAGDTMSGFPAAATESTAYDEATRQEFVESAISGQSLDNTASRATFTINATKTIYGAALVSNSTKSATAGTLLAGSRFAASRNVVDNDQMLIDYTFTASDA